MHLMSTHNLKDNLVSESVETLNLRIHMGKKISQTNIVKIYCIQHTTSFVSKINAYYHPVLASIITCMILISHHFFSDHSDRALLNLYNKDTGIYWTYMLAYSQWL